jgi:hypothetical protein
VHDQHPLTDRHVLAPVDEQRVDDAVDGAVMV